MAEALQLHQTNADIYVPDGAAPADALARTTALGIGAHPDDLEILGIPGILAAYDQPGQWFTGVTVTDGAHPPQAGPFAGYTPEAMADQRRTEQRAAADLGRYGAVVQLGYPSGEVKGARPDAVAADLAAIIDACRPETIYTHVPTDKHDTHVAVMLRVVEALRRLPGDARPRACYGMEVWRDLDWAPDELKVVFDCSAHTELQEALLRVFESQIGSGKRYDRAALGRRTAHATYLDAYAADAMAAAAFGLDLLPVITGDAEPLDAFCDRVIHVFRDDVHSRLRRVRG